MIRIRCPNHLKSSILACRPFWQTFVKELVDLWSSVKTSIELSEDATCATNPVMKFPHPYILHSQLTALRKWEFGNNSHEATDTEQHSAERSPTFCTILSIAAEIQTSCGLQSSPSAARRELHWNGFLWQSSCIQASHTLPSAMWSVGRRGEKHPATGLKSSGVAISGVMNHARQVWV